MLPDWMKASMILRRLASFFGFSRLGDFLTQPRGDALEIHRFENLADRLRANHRREAILAIFVLGAQILVLREELTLLHRGEARIDHDVGFEIENSLEILERHVEQEADARR